MSEVIGSIEVVASINTRNYDAAKSKIEKGNEDLEGNAKKTSSGFSAAWAGAIGGLVATVAQKGFAMISSSIDSAVKRVDTLNNSARTFENMGIAATDSRKAMTALEKSITGLPTPLDGAVRGMTALTATYGDIDKGQKVFSALNNAILGFGGTSAEVDNAITQLSQLPMDGPLDAQTWNSLRNSGLTPVLTAMAKESGTSVAEMRKAFGSGELTVQDFTDRLVNMNTEGGGGLKSLETIAKDSTKGIGTGFSNMQTAITRGLAKIIDAIGSENISGAITVIGKAFEETLKVISTGITFISDNKDIFAPIAVGIGTVVGAMTAWRIATTAWTTATTLAKKAQLALNVAMKANPIGLIIGLVAALIAGLIYFFTQTETGRKIFQTAFNAIKTTASNVWNSIKSTFSGVATFFRNAFQGAYNNVKSVFGNLYGFFRGIWSKVTGLFRTVGTAIGNAIGGTFRGAVNSVIRGAVNIINSFINTINSIKNKIPVVGKSIPSVPRLAAPQFADGGFTGRGGKYDPAGIVHKGEYVIPKSAVDQRTGLPKLGATGGREYNIGTINIASEVDGDRWLRRLTDNQEITSSRLVPNQSYM